MPLLKAAIPSLPSMRGRFTLPCSTLRVHTSAQVSGTVESGDMRRREVTCSQFLANLWQGHWVVGPLWLERPRHRPGSPRSTKVTKVNTDPLPEADRPQPQHQPGDPPQQ